MIGIALSLTGLARGELCGIIPSLSQLKDAKRQSRLKEAHFRNIQLYLEVRKGTAGMFVCVRVQVCVYVRAYMCACV